MAVVLAELVSTLCLGLPGCAGPPPAEENPPPASVKWEPALPLVLEEWTELVGTTCPLPNHEAHISAPVEGRVLATLRDKAGKQVGEGQHVEPGTVLVQLDPTLIDANLAKAAASLSVLIQKEEQARIQEKFAQLEVERTQETKGGPGGLIGVSPIDRKKAVIGLEDAQSKVRGAQLEKDAGKRDVESLQAQRRLYDIVSPIAGRLGRILVVQGQTIAPGTPVADVVDVDDQIDVLCFVSSHVIRGLALGQPARIGGLEENAGSAGEVEGKVVYLAPQGETDTGNSAVKVRFPNRVLGLRANMTVRIRVLTKPGKACRSLPESAFMEDQDPPTVVVVEDIEKKKNADGKEEDVGKARLLSAVTGVRDPVLHQVEVLRLEDREPDPKKRWKGTLETGMFITQKGQGLQTGDVVKLEADED
jgi:RND family efflux transporter MFP subunit